MEQVLLNIQFLEYLAYEAYRNADYQNSLDLNARIIKSAEEVNDHETVVRAKFWKCESLKLLGRYKQALTEAMEAVSKKYTAADPRDLFNIYTNIIALGLSLPTSLESIHRSLKQAEQFARQNGRPHWHSKLLLLRSNVLRNRGMYSEALDRVQEAWAKYQAIYPIYAMDTYMKNIARLLINMKRFDDAEKFFTYWDNQPNDQPGRRLRRKILREIQLARARGNKEKYVNLARAFSQRHSSLYDSYHFIQVQIIAGHFDSIKDLLAKYLYQERKSESLYKQNFLWRLIGDFHHNKARKMLGLQTVDCRYEDEKTVSITEIPEKIHKKALHELKRAEKAYKNANSYANQIDEKLKATVNSELCHELLAKNRHIINNIAVK